MHRPTLQSTSDTRSSSRSRTPPRGSGIERLIHGTIPDPEFSLDLVTRAESRGWLRYRNRVGRVTQHAGLTDSQVSQSRHRQALRWHLAQRQLEFGRLESRLRVTRETYVRSVFLRISSICQRLEESRGELLSDSGPGSVYHRQVLEAHQILQACNIDIAALEVDIGKAAARTARFNLQIARALLIPTTRVEDLPELGLCICPVPPCICLTGQSAVFE